MILTYWLDSVSGSRKLYHILTHASYARIKLAHPAPPVSPEWTQRLPWTGNMRELRNVIERLVILSGKEITEGDVKTYAVPRG